MKTVQRKIKDLRHAKYNPRQITEKEFEDLKASLEKFDCVEPAVVNINSKRKDVIVGGNQRIEVAKALGWKTFPCVEVNLPLAKEKELNVRLNKNTGSWDWDILANNFDVGELINWGFGPDELSMPEDTSPGKKDPDETPPLPKKAKTKKGQLFQLGDHRLLCEDATKTKSAVKLDVLGCVLMVTDPPYGVEYDPEWRNKYEKGFGKYKAKGAKINNDDKVDWSDAYKHFPGHIIYVWHAGRYASEVQRSIESVGFEIISQIIWNKQHFAMSRGDYHWKHEPCWYAVKKDKKHNWQGDRKQSTVWDISSLNPAGRKEEKVFHGTQKPIECMERPIRNNSKKGDLIYDCFGGSGSTLIACEKTGRKCRMMEIDPLYCDVIIKRWEDFTGKKAKLIK